MIKSEFLRIDKRLVLFSGGADSMALLHLMKDLKQVDLVLHFNHNLRGAESDKDELFCTDFCKKHQLPFKSVSLDLASARQADEGDEQVARRLRLAYLEEHFTSWNIYLGHHQDDVQESFFMRAMRGANSSGLCALRKQRDLGSLHLIRPLLTYSREDLRAYLTKHELQWREDASNQDADYCDRNYLRNDLIPKLTQLGKGLKHTLKHIAEDDDFIRQQAAKELLEGLSVDGYRNLHSALKPRVLRLFLEQQAVHYVPTAASLQRLAKECENLPEAYKDIPLGEGVELRIWKNGEISLPPRTQSIEWDWGKQESIEFEGYRLFLSTSKSAEYFKLSELPKQFVLRTAQKGDKMKILGRKKSTLLSKLFSDAKLSQQERCSFPLLCTNDEIIYLPGLRRSEFAAVKKEHDHIGISYEKL
ncbi:tRNA lysidine(34) synthetase TilS [Lentisphaera profundi]|uniref:tRNA(Ile)-lysidine synthase n=1 Tax=Lentisphaera profundi TaxID=1658616 RepID=A0ABY7VV11_9BACT|nr:tRNA lysidine(34) synthetase TilS [Lentisphaera profundi]WDE97907.1 tRNA lysidine(34) synthetase TilS [Lentisphaera profundi]